MCVGKRFGDDRTGGKRLAERVPVVSHLDEQRSGRYMLIESPGLDLDLTRDARDDLLHAVCDLLRKLKVHWPVRALVEA